jgi:hypothetical protein
LITPFALFAQKGHHHHHFMTKEDMNLLMYGSHEAIAEGYSQKCDDNHKLKERITQLQNEHWQIKLAAKGFACGVIVSVAAAAIIYVCKQ